MTLQIVDRCEVALGKVGYMDIVAHTCAIVGIIVIPENLQLVQPANRHAGNIGHEVVRNPHRVFTNLARFMRTNRVEVSQKHRPFCRVGCGPVADDLLDKELGPAIGVCRLQRMRLVIWQILRCAIDGCR